MNLEDKTYSYEGSISWEGTFGVSLLCIEFRPKTLQHFQIIFENTRRPSFATEVICSSWRREKFNGDTSLSFKVLLPVKTSPPVKVCVPQREDMWQKLVFSHTQRVGQNLPGQVHSFEAADSCNTVLQDLYREVNVAAFSGNSGRHW